MLDKRTKISKNKRTAGSTVVQRYLQMGGPKGSAPGAIMGSRFKVQGSKFKVSLRSTALVLSGATSG
jgi:hypothetical protein